MLYSLYNPYLLTSWSRALLQKLTVFQLVQKFPPFLWNPKFHYRSPKWRPPVPILSQLDPGHIPTSHTFWRSILILSSHIRLGTPSGLFPSGSPTKTLYTPLLSPIRATCLAHLIHLDFITQIILDEEYRTLSALLCSFHHSPVNSSLLGPNILLNTLFSNTLSPHSFLNVSDQVSHPYKTTGKIIILYNFVFKFLCSKLHDKRFCTALEQTFPDFSLHLISSWIQFWFVKIVIKY